MIKIYFAGSIRGGRDDVDLYMQIIHYLSDFGTVLTEHVGTKELSDKGEGDLDDQFIHDRDIDWLKESDIIIAEVTNPSLGVGYEIGRAIEFNKKIVCLFRNVANKNLSAMISGNKQIKTIEYVDIDDLKQKINQSLFISNDGI